MNPIELPAGVKAAVLCDALPYITPLPGAHRRRQVRRQRPCRPGGLLFEQSLAEIETAALQRFAEDVVLLRSIGILPVVVHGAGPQIGALMARLGKVPEFRDGLRVTDSETLDIARMVLVGKVNRDIVGTINVHGPLAVGLSGEDAGLIMATPRDPALGYVGDVAAVDPTILHRLAGRGPRTGHRHDRLGPQPVRPTTSTPTRWPVPIAESLRRRSWSSSPMSTASAPDAGRAGKLAPPARRRTS